MFFILPPVLIYKSNTKYSTVIVNEKENFERIQKDILKGITRTASESFSQTKAIYRYKVKIIKILINN
jgi:hypothetical protein